MAIFSRGFGAARRDLRLSAMLIAATLCLAACGEPPPEAVSPRAASETPTPESTPEDVSGAAPPMDSAQTSAAPDDLFVGWYFEQGGTGRLQACGASTKLQVADATFLRELNGKRGGGTKPVYVRLRVRLAPGSRLEVTEVQQFGVDETPVTDCVLAPGSV